MRSRHGTTAGLLRWVNERWPVSAVLRWSLDEEIPGGARLTYVLGSAALFLFALQVVTGIWQMFYYAPTVDHAYDSVSYLRFEVPFGWLVHGLHYWGANAFLVVIGLHMARVFIWGAYKKPRELTWLLGLALLLTAAGFFFTGALLPWDELGYWAAEVGTSIAGTVPVVGSFTEHLMRGGERMGQLTLLRFFTLHTVVLPGVLALLAVLHLVAFRRFGSTGPWQPAQRARRGSFWPDQGFRDITVASVLLIALIGLSAYLPAQISGPADPLGTAYQPKPEWSFLFLYQALKLFKGGWEPVGAVGVPGVLLLLLVLVPFIDRSPYRSPLRRPYIMLGGLSVAALVVGFGIAGYISHPGLSLPATASAGTAAAATQNLPASAQEGAKLFASSGCRGCHTVNGKGGFVGPNLSNEGNKGRSRQWLMVQIAQPKSHFPKTVMPSFASLSDKQRGELADYLLSLKKKGGAATASTQSAPPATPTSSGTEVPPSGKQGGPGPASGMVGNPKHGAVLYAGYCESCHGEQGKGGVPNPGSDDGTVPPLNPMDQALASANPRIFAENIGRFIQHGSQPPGPHPAIHMPAFGDRHSLTQQQIANIESYVLSLNGVNRAKIIHPGVAPRRFFWIALGVFAVLGVFAAAGLWLTRRRNR